MSAEVTNPDTGKRIKVAVSHLLPYAGLPPSLAKPSDAVGAPVATRKRARTVKLIRQHFDTNLQQPYTIISGGPPAIRHLFHNVSDFELSKLITKSRNTHTCVKLTQTAVAFMAQGYQPTLHVCPRCEHLHTDTGKCNEISHECGICKTKFQLEPHIFCTPLAMYGLSYSEGQLHLLYSVTPVPVRFHHDMNL